MDQPKSAWTLAVEQNPGHSQWYVERFRQMAASGADLVGEARLIDAIVPRGASILDAGCGPGRHAGYLAERGHQVVGVDLDPVLIEAAEADFPGPTYFAQDLAALNLPDEAKGPFDAILCAGNVLGFVHPATRRPILANLRSVLADEGRLVTGFGAGRGYVFDDFFADAKAVGLNVQQRYATWELRPFEASSNFLVAFLTR